MSKVTDIYDNLRTLVGSTLTAYTELPDVYDIEMNPSILLTKSYAVGYGDETNDNRYLCNVLSLTRSFNIILINKITTTTHNTTARRTLEKALIDDAYTFIKALMSNITLSGVAVDAFYGGQTGVEYITDNDGTEVFMSLSLDVGISYQETY